MWVRICRSEIGKLVCQAESEQIFTFGEIPVFDFTIICLTSKIKSTSFEVLFSLIFL